MQFVSRLLAGNMETTDRYRNKRIVRWKVNFCDVFSPSMTQIRVVLFKWNEQTSGILRCRLSWDCWGYGNCGQVCRQNYRPMKDKFRWCAFSFHDTTQRCVIEVKWRETSRMHWCSLSWDCLQLGIWKLKKEKEKKKRKCRQIGIERIIVRWKISVCDVFSVSVRTN